MDFGRLILFLFLNTFIFLPWYGLQSRQSHTVASRLLIASVLSIAQIMVSIFLLGLPKPLLTAVNLAILNVGFSSILLIFVIARRKLWGSLRDLSAATIEVFQTINRETILKILALLTAVTIVWIILLGAIYPSIEWDALMYHLPAVGHYMQQQSLADPALPMDAYSKYGIDGSVWVNSFPKNIELIFLWATIMPGHDKLVDLVELGFGLIGIVAVYALATRMGVTRKWAICAGFLFFLTPIVIAQSRSNLIDLSNSVLILIALALLYPGRARRQRNEIIIAGIAVGIVVGAKWSGLMFLPVLWLMLVGQRLYWNHSSQLPKLNKLLYESVFFLGPAFLFGSYWYLKNWYMYGNPLWPFRISVLGIRVFDGVLNNTAVMAGTFPDQLQGMNTAQMLWASWRELIIFGYDYDMKLGGLGPFWFVFALPAIFYLFRWIIKRRDIAQGLIFVAATVMLLLHPQNWWTRYTLFIAGLGAIAFVKIRASGYKPNIARLIDIMVILTVVYSTIASWATSYYQPVKIQALLAKRPALRTGANVRPEIISQAYDYIVKKTAGKPANIAYGSGLDFTYPLWGPDLKNRVYYIDPLDLHTWIGKLKDKRIKYVLIRTNGPEWKFIKKSSLFTRTFHDQRGGYEVYAFSG
ncbi:MAG TPA: phospholipid carrier-dependent glycosyltransferase [Actinobacteria bacterium]|nr:phospholipid carrier-dependent glycosyltransferase [Actinomycetota bacterium]